MRGGWWPATGPATATMARVTPKRKGFKKKGRGGARGRPRKTGYEQTAAARAAIATRKGLTQKQFNAVKAKYVNNAGRERTEDEFHH